MRSQARNRLPEAGGVRTWLLIPLVVLAIGGGAPPPPVEARDLSHVAATSDTLRGIVFDSLAQQPLVGATVMGEPGGLSVLTDGQGRFVLGGPERIRRLAVFHGLLERTGIGSLSLAIDSTSIDRRALVIATPSLATVWSRLCPGIVRTRGRDGIV